MQEQFRMKEGGAGNVLSNAQTGGLSVGQLAYRNESVDSTPTAEEYKKPLVILQRSTYTDQLDEIFKAFQKKTSNLDDIYAIYHLAHDAFLGANPPNFLIVHARAMMLNKSLIHYDDAPTIEKDDDGSYRKESSKILLSNGGVISAKKDESACIFYHPFAWEYVVKKMEFMATWKAEYAGIGAHEGYGYLEAEAYCMDCKPFGFAPFVRLKKQIYIDDATIGDLSNYSGEGLNISGIWYVPEYSTSDYSKFYQAREGSAEYSFINAPLKYNLYSSSNIRLCSVSVDTNNTATIHQDTSVPFVPIFIVKGNIPVAKVIDATISNSNYERIALGEAECVIPLNVFQENIKLKSPFLRSTRKERGGEGMTQSTEIRQWAESNLVPPQMSSTDWWKDFNTSLEATGVKRCGEYGEDGEVYGIVYKMPETHFNLVDLTTCTPARNEQLGGILEPVILSNEYASDYLTYAKSGMKIKGYDAIYASSQIAYEIEHNATAKIHIHLDITESWKSLPEEIVRTAIKNDTRIANAIRTDADVGAIYLEKDGKTFELSPISGGADIPLGQIFEAFDIDLDSMPIDDLVATLKSGWTLNIVNPNISGSYISIGGDLSQIVNEW